MRGLIDPPPCPLFPTALWQIKSLPLYHVHCRLVTAKTKICYICIGWLVEYSFRVSEKVNFSVLDTSTHVLVAELLLIICFF